MVCRFSSMVNGEALKRPRVVSPLTKKRTREKKRREKNHFFLFGKEGGRRKKKKEKRGEGGFAQLCLFQTGGGEKVMRGITKFPQLGVHA